jgi:subtilisin family serine protease
MPRLGLPREIVSDNDVPETLIGYVSVQGAESVFAGKRERLHHTAKAYHAREDDREGVRRDLEQSGFSIIAESPLGFSVSAPGGAYEEITGGVLQAKERLTTVTPNYSAYVTTIDIVGEHQPAALGIGRAGSEALKVDGVIIEKPRIYHQQVFPSPIPPNSPKFHLRLPQDVALALNAAAAQRRGENGEGVTIAMPDSGQYRHPFFTAHAYAVRRPITVVPGTSPNRDPVGHGTGESANIFAVAPGADLQPIRASDNAGNLVGAIAGFLRAKELRPRIITNSWGSDSPYPPPAPPGEDELALAAEIQDAIEQGMLVVFSAGNGQFSIEPQVPGVLAAGGVYMDESGNLRASDYASGYESPWFDNVVVPTVSGLVGLQPRAQYLMLPVPPGSQLDVSESQPAPPFDPSSDGTAADDGWALFSGTSAAAPQLAGVAALILGARPDLTPAQVIECMTATAVDVLTGRSFPQRFNNPATRGPDLATGAGLVNATAALDYAIDNF